MGISLPMVEKHLAKGMLKIADRLSEHEPRLRPFRRDNATMQLLANRRTMMFAVIYVLSGPVFAGVRGSYLS